MRQSNSSNENKKLLPLPKLLRGFGTVALLERWRVVIDVKTETGCVMQELPRLGDKGELHIFCSREIGISRAFLGCDLGSNCRLYTSSFRSPILRARLGHKKIIELDRIPPEPPHK